jgi:uncharacterized protein YbaR (Trm112 family)
MIDTTLLDIICCPETKLDVTLADSALVEQINKGITEGRIVNKAGHAVTEPIDGALVRSDSAVVYPVKQDIPIMLIDEAIELTQL